MFFPGEQIEIRSLEEIVATLDGRGTLDGLPFMPEMRRFCGERRRVFRRAHKFCIENGTVGGFDDVVILEDVRCDGSAHRGCGKGCAIFWKEAWLKRSGEAAREISKIGTAVEIPAPPTDPFCQATELVSISKPVLWWNFGQYMKDIQYGHASPWTVFRSFCFLIQTKLKGRGHGLEEEPQTKQRFPSGNLNLQVGERVRVKPMADIEKTLDSEQKTNGLWFTPEMATFCGKEFRVRSRVDRVILEGNPKYREVKDAVILEGVICTGFCRRMCARSAFHFWREAWLERVNS